MSAITGGTALGQPSNIKSSSNAISSGFNIKTTNISPIKTSTGTVYQGTRTAFNPEGTYQQKFQMENLKKTDPLLKFDAKTELDNVSKMYEDIITQKLYADFIANMIGHEKENYEKWAESLNLKPTEIQDLGDFIDMIDEGNYTNNEALNGKIVKVLEYIPDIMQSLLKAEGLAPAIKIMEGKNPVVDEVKFTIEKVISPLLKKVGANLEKKFTGETGKQIAKMMVDWGEKLATLPSKVLEKIGPYDIVASVVDLGLLAIDQATGNYRARNHELPDELLGIPVIGSVASGLMSIRDLLDTALGVPTNEEGVKIIRDNLYNNLWKPSMEEYYDVMNELAGKEEELERAKIKIEKQLEKEKVNLRVQETLPEAIKLYGQNNKKGIINFYLREVDKPYNPSIPSASVVQNSINEINSKLTSLNNDLNKAKADLRKANEEFGRGAYYLQQGAQERINKAEKAIKEEKAKLESQKRQLEKSKINDSNKEIASDISNLVDLYLGEKNIETVKDEIQDLETLTGVEEIISPIEIQGRTVLENIFTMSEQYRLAKGAIDNLKQQISKYGSDMYNAAFIMNQGPSEVGWETWELAERVYNEAERKKPQAEAKLREIEQLLPTIESEVNKYQDQLELIIAKADEEDIDLRFLRQSPNYEEALKVIQDDSKIWEDIFKGIASAGRGFDPFFF